MSLAVKKPSPRIIAFAGISVQKWSLLLLAGLLVTLFLALAGFTYGFPLDDGWIHHTYARNLAEHGRWEYVPGVVSAGSTAPLWTAWLALGYLLHLPYWLWTFASGVFCLAWVGIAGISLYRRLFGSASILLASPVGSRHSINSWLAGLLIVGAWPLVWAAGSGMETLLFIALGLTLCERYFRLIEAPSKREVIILGLTGGALILTRPDGLPLVLLIALALIWALRGSWRGMKNAGIFLLIIFLTLLPYFALNYAGSGTIWPNTLYAKQAEYGFLQETPLLTRLLRLLYFSWGGPENGWRGMSGAHLLLFPGLAVAGILTLYHDLKNRRLAQSLPLLWAAGHILLYAWRLPVTYQHGRYLLAALPVWILYGVAGWSKIIMGKIKLKETPQRLRDTEGFPLKNSAPPCLCGESSNLQSPSRRQWFMTRIALLIAGILWFFFLFIGGTQYATDVAFIDGEMVTAAHWLQENTPPEAIIATHDIGAIGYFSQRRLVDLAGLVSPEVVPLLADEDALSDFVLQGEADYLVTAPGWAYENMVHDRGLMPAFSTNFIWTIENDSNNMTIYPLKN